MSLYDVLIFDMDGVLVEVSESYRETIVQTVRHFTGKSITRESIQEYKNQGGWNNDWALSQKIAADLGVTVEYAAVVQHFNSLFLDGGLIHRERWIPMPGWLERLEQKYELAIFTGRSQVEAKITLGREGLQGRFAPVVTADDVLHEKPAPDGLLHIAGQKPGKRMLYLGDTVDDARSGRAAGVPFVGIAAPGSPRHDELAELLRAEGAIAVLDDVNQLEEVLA